MYPSELPHCLTQLPAFAVSAPLMEDDVVFRAEVGRIRKAGVLLMLHEGGRVMGLWHDGAAVRAAA
jgi:hypothetical protein